MLKPTIDLKDSLPAVTMPLPGPKAAAILKQRAESVPNAVGTQYPVVIKRGAGAMIEDVDGNRLLDWVGGVGVMNVGYSQPEIIAAVQKQAEAYFHSMINVTTHPGYVELTRRLAELAPLNATHKKAMLINSGAESLENAVKIARSYTKRNNIIVFSGAFHGRTALTVAMTAKRSYSYGLDSNISGIYRAPYPYLYRAPKGYSHSESIRYYLDQLELVFAQGCPAEFVAAIVLEPIQGEGGFIPAPFEYVAAVRQICNKYGILLIADEVQTGFGRSGKLFVSNYWQEKGFAPDIIATAKSIGAGLPLAAVISTAKIMDGIQPGIVGSTFGGNAMACAAALKVLDIIHDQDLCQKALRNGKIIKAGYLALQAKYPQIGDVRGIGSMVGIEFVHDPVSKQPYPELVQRLITHAVQNGLLIENAGLHDNVIRFLCPLVATPEQLHAGLTIFENSLKAALAD